MDWTTKYWTLTFHSISILMSVYSSTKSGQNSSSNENLKTLFFPKIFTELLRQFFIRKKFENKGTINNNWQFYPKREVLLNLLQNNGRL